MNEEEIKAIEYFKDDISYLEEELKRPNFEGRYITIRSAELEKLRVLLNLIKKQETEIEDLKWKNKIYVKSIKSHQSKIETLKRDFEIVDHECSRLEQEDIRKDMIINEMASHIKHPRVIFTGGRGHQYIIEYFENKVKESK